MAILKKSETMHMSETQLKEKINDLKKEMIKSNAQISMGTMPENPGRIKEVKRTIARLNTLIKQLKEKNKESEKAIKEAAEKKTKEKSGRDKKQKEEKIREKKAKLSKKLKELK